MRRAGAGLVILTLSLGSGCESSLKPKEDPRLAEVLPGRVDWEAVKPAVDKLLEQVAELDARAQWADHVARSPANRPHIRVEEFSNRCVERHDVVALKNKVINAITRQGILEVVAAKASKLADDDLLGGVNAERDYSDQGKVRKKPAARTQAHLSIRGAITEEGGSYVFRLSLQDTKIAKLLANQELRVPKAKKQETPAKKKTAASK